MLQQIANLSLWECSICIEVGSHLLVPAEVGEKDRPSLLASNRTRGPLCNVCYTPTNALVSAILQILLTVISWEFTLKMKSRIF